VVLGVTAITVGMWACGVGGLGPVSETLINSTGIGGVDILLPGPQGLRVTKEPGSITEV